MTSNHSWPLVLMYHGVIPAVSGFTSVDLSVIFQEEFERQLKILRRYYSILHPDEFVELLIARRACPRRSALVTMDDGFQNLLDYALPVAETIRVPLLAFVATGHMDDGEWLWFSRLQALKLRSIDRPRDLASALPLADMERLLENIGAPYWRDGDVFHHQLQDGMKSAQLASASKSNYLTVGGHTVNHPCLPIETEEIVYKEITENKLTLEAITGKKISLFAYPQGLYNQAVASQVATAGYIGAFTIRQNRSRLSPEFDRYEIPRVGIYKPGNLWFWYKCLGLSDRVKGIKYWLSPSKEDQVIYPLDY